MTRIVTPEEAQRLLDLMPGDREEAEYTVFDRMARYAPFYETYAAAPDLAHTVIQQAEQIERLQRALSLNVIRGGPNPLTRFEYMYERGELRPSDMEVDNG